MAGDGWAEERERMVRRQLVPRGITDERVLTAVRAVPRHRFVPPGMERDAHADGPLPIGYRQTISQPFIVAFVCQALALGPEARVLEIGAGSGYQAAVLGRLAAEVYALEIVPALADGAREVLASLGIANVDVVEGDGARGLPERAPFDAIVLAAAAEDVPRALFDQLAPGGRLIAPVEGAVPGEQDLVLFERVEGGVSRRVLLPVRFVPMTGAVGRG